MGKRGRAKKAASGSMPEVIMPEKTTPDAPAATSWNMGLNRNGKIPTLKEMPTEEIERLADSHEKVMVTIQRRNNRGQLANLGYSGMLWTPAEVLSVADWLLPRAGGGLYVIRVSDPKNPVQRLVPSFEVPIDAQPKTPIPYHTNVIGAPIFGVTHEARQPFYPTPAMPIPPGPVIPITMPSIDPSKMRTEEQDNAPVVPGVLPPPRNPMSSKWSQGLDPVAFAHMAQSAAAQAPMAGAPQVFGYGVPGAMVAGATFNSDQLAVDQLRRMEADRASLQTKLDALLERADARERDYEKQLREQQERHREELHNLRLEALKAELTAKTAAPAPQGLKVPELIAALAPFAPVFAAFVTSSKESATKSMEVQQQGLNQLMQLMVSQANRPSPDPLSAVEKLMPLLTAQRGGGGEGHAALVEALGNMNLQQTAMVAQLLEGLAAQGGGDSTPAWLPIVQQIGQGMLAMAQGAAADRQRAMLGTTPQFAAPPRSLGAPPAQVTRPAPQPTAYRTLDEEPAQVPQAPQVAAPQPIVTPPPQPMVNLNPAMLDYLPAEYRTPEWRAIIIALHEGQDPEHVGRMIGKHLDHLLDFDMLPSALGNFLVEPREALARLVQPLPIYTANHAYCEVVIEETLQALYQLGTLELTQEEEEPGDEEPEDEGDETPEEDVEAQAS